MQLVHQVSEALELEPLLIGDGGETRGRTHHDVQ